MEEWRKDARRDAVITDIEALVPNNHLLRKIEKVMDYDWLYERLDPYDCHDNGRKGTVPVVLIRMILIKNLCGIPLLHQTHQRIRDKILLFSRYLITLRYKYEICQIPRFSNKNEGPLKN